MGGGMQFFVVPFRQFLQSKGTQSQFIEADEADAPSDPSLYPAMMHRVKGQRERPGIR